MQALVRDVSRAVAPRSSSVGFLTCGSGSASSSACTFSSGSALGEGAGEASATFRGRSQSAVDGAFGLSQPCTPAAEAHGAIGGAGSRRGSRGRGKGRAVKGGHAEGDWISTGDAGWDRLLGGGVRLGSLVEISGER